MVVIHPMGQSSWQLAVGTGGHVDSSKYITSVCPSGRWPPEPGPAEADVQDVRADGHLQGPGCSPRAEDAAQRQGLKKSKEYPAWRGWIQAGFQEQEESQGCSSQSQASPVAWAQGTGWLVPVRSPECWPGPLED